MERGPCRSIGVRPGEGVEDGRLGRAAKEATNSRPPSYSRHCSLSLQSVAVRHLQFGAVWRNPGVRNCTGTLAWQRLQSALYRHFPAAPRNHGWPTPLCVGVVNSSHVQQQSGRLQRRVKRSQSNVRFLVSSVCSGSDYCRDFRLRIL